MSAPSSVQNAPSTTLRRRYLTHVHAFNAAYMAHLATLALHGEQLQLDQDTVEEVFFSGASRAHAVQFDQCHYASALWRVWLDLRSRVPSDHISEALLDEVWSQCDAVIRGNR